jgi:hypothetical protein
MAKPANRMFTQHSRDALLADPRSNSTSQPGTSDALQNASVRCSVCGVPMPEPPNPDGDGICLFDTCKACIEAQRQKDAASTDGSRRQQSAKEKTRFSCRCVTRTNRTKGRTRWRPANRALNRVFPSDR